MFRRIAIIAVVVICQAGYCGQGGGYGGLLAGSSDEVGLWWALGELKVRPETEKPTEKDDAIVIRAARNEPEAAQLVVAPKKKMTGFVVKASDLYGPGGAKIGAEKIDLLCVRYVTTEVATDKSCEVGEWPDPLPPFAGAMDIEAGRNQAFWVRVNVPKNARAGLYSGNIELKADGFEAKAPLEVEVFDFALPERMTCVTAFGLSEGNIRRYHGLKTEEQRREVFDKYLANFSAHHISPYNPAPFDSVKVNWPDVKRPAGKWDKWENVRIVSNEAREGKGSLLIYDDEPTESVTVSYRPLIEIPKGGLRFKFWYRTALEGHKFTVTLNLYDEDGKWMSGRNMDRALVGEGKWEQFDELLDKFPAGAHSVRMNLRGARWTEDGEQTGLVWFDDISLTDAGTGEELVEGGDFEPQVRTELVATAEDLQVGLDFDAWDKAMSRAIDYEHFNSFLLRIPGMGGGTFHEIQQPELLGFGENDPEYGILFDSYCKQVERHLGAKGWLDEAFVYWFDEPSPKQYDFVKNGFDKLKRACPKISRMLTEQPEEKLFGGPNIYCVASYLYDHKRAEERREYGDKFWWYVCTEPKAPYCTLFIDHPGTELRVWLWQTFKRNIEGILVWQSNYWTSEAAYPDGLQNPYEDPMGWMSGYSTPSGKKVPWGNGDGRFVYPPLAAAGEPSEPVLEGPVDSIRWEMLRDGIEDYEYLVMLRKLIEEKKAKISELKRQENLALLEVPESITQDMTHFTKDPGAIEKQRVKIARAIEELSRLF